MKRSDLSVLLSVIAITILLLFTMDHELSVSVVFLLMTGLYFGVFLLSIGGGHKKDKTVVSFISKMYLFVLIGHIFTVGYTFTVDSDLSFFFIILTLLEAVILLLSVTVYKKRVVDTLRLYIISSIILGTIFAFLFFNPDLTGYEVVSKSLVIYVVYIVNIVLYFTFVLVSYYKDNRIDYIDHKWLVLLGMTKILSFMIGILFMDQVFYELVYLVIYVSSGIILFYSLYFSSIMSPYKKVVSDLEISEERVQSLLRIDQLTGIANRSYLYESIDKFFRLAKREKQTISFLIIDLDDFKEFNEGFGQSQGDVIIQRVAKVIEKSCMRPLDIVGRYDGTEFLICLPNSDFDGTRVVCKRTEEEIKNQRFKHPTKENKYLTVSMGYVTVTPSQDDSFKDYIVKAEEEMMKIKRLGKNAFMGKDLDKEKENE